MKLALVVASFLISFTQGASPYRYGLLRVGPPSGVSPAKVNTQLGERSLFDEDFSLAFRQLFGYKADLSMSMMAAPLSMSMAQLSMAQLSMAQLSMAQLSMAHLSLSMGSAFGMLGDETTYTGSVQGASSGQVLDKSVGNNSANATSKGIGAGAAGTVAAVGAIAAVGLVAAIFAKNRQNAPSSVSVASNV